MIGYKEVVLNELDQVEKKVSKMDFPNARKALEGVTKYIYCFNDALGEYAMARWLEDSS